ncbi:MAG TPA: hypothetical protein VGQ81_16270, partial [Acidobacteriota bacterium]|nr:hypothetical protein [Acidobacteriota bacterium]
RAGLMAWKNDRWPQGCASSALGFILAPSQKAAGLVRFRGLGKCRNSKARRSRADIATDQV